jgi:hypothetical protein
MTTDRNGHRNYWSSYREPLWEWEISFDWTRTRPEQLVWWTGEALAILYETGIYKVYAVPEIGYSSPTADPRPLAALIANRYRTEGVIDMFYFSEFAWIGNPDYEIATTLSYFGNQDVMVTEDCKDVGDLQIRLHPWLDETVDFVYHRKAIVISGALFAPYRPNYATVNVCYNPKYLYLRMMTYTDIWLPTVVGWNHPDFDGEPRFPNQELAARNAPRLNQAIRALREMTAAIGGTWQVADEYEGREIGFQEAGVIL